MTMKMIPIMTMMEYQIFEVKYSGSHAGPWKPADDRRATLCPRIKVNLACGKYIIIIGNLWDGRDWYGREQFYSKQDETCMTGPQ